MDSEHAVGDGRRKDKEFDTLVNLTMEDCNAFVDRLVALKFVNYKIFAEVWKEMKFSLIFWRPTLDEVNDFTELLFFIVKNMMLPPYSLTRRLCSMYILYGVYVKQPGEGYCKLKISLKEWIQLVDMVKFCVKEDLKEHVFIFCKLIQLEAFAFCASPLDLVSLKHVDLVESKNAEETLLENFEVEGDNWGDLEELLDSEFFKELGDAEENYNNMDIKQFTGDLEPTRDLTSRLHLMFITKESNVQNVPRQQERNVIVERSDSEQSPSSSMNSAGTTPTSSAPSSAGAISRWQITRDHSDDKAPQKPRGFAVVCKNRTPNELRVLLPPRGYEHIESKNNRSLFKKTVPQQEKPKKKLKYSESICSLDDSATPSIASLSTQASSALSSVPSMPLL